jgi:hypothetical protein
MGICGVIGRPPVKPWAGRTWPRARAHVPRSIALLGVAAVALVSALAGCTSNDRNELLIDPGRYSVFKCDDLAARWKLVSTREKELRGLMDRANQSGGGAVVGSLAYRADYNVVIEDEGLLQRTAAEKNCGLSFQTQSGQPQSTQFQSDQSIR